MEPSDIKGRCQARYCALFIFQTARRDAQKITNECGVWVINTHQW